MLVESLVSGYPKETINNFRNSHAAVFDSFERNNSFRFINKTDRNISPSLANKNGICEQMKNKDFKTLIQGNLNSKVYQKIQHAV